MLIFFKIRQDFIQSLSDNSMSIINQTKIFKSQKQFIDKLCCCKLNFDILQNMVENKLKVDEDVNNFNKENKYDLIKQNLQI